MGAEVWWWLCAVALAFAVGLVCGLALAARHELRAGAMRRHPSRHMYTSQSWSRHHGA